MSLSSSVSLSRSQNRLSIVLPVKISPQAHPAQVSPACTCEISSGGAKLMKISGLAAGDVVWIARNTRRAKFKVVWVGGSGSEFEGKIGVESLEPEKFIWDDDLRGRLA